MKKLGWLFFIILIILILLRTGLSFIRLECKYVLNPETNRRICDYNNKSDKFQIVGRLGKVIKLYKLGDKNFFLYKFNTSKSLISHWGILLVDDSEPVEISIVTNRSLDYRSEFVIFEEIMRGEELRKYLNKEYFGCEACQVIDEAFLFGSTKMDNLISVLFPNYIRLIALRLYEK